MSLNLRINFSMCLPVSVHVMSNMFQRFPNTKSSECFYHITGKTGICDLFLFQL